jgi:hypothetical protein
VVSTILMLDFKKVSYESLAAMKTQLALLDKQFAQAIKDKEDVRALKDKELAAENYIAQFHYEDSVKTRKIMELPKQHVVVTMHLDSGMKQYFSNDLLTAKQLKYQDSINNLNIADNSAQLEALKMQASFYWKPLAHDSLLKGDEMKKTIAKFDISFQRMRQKYSNGRFYNVNIHIGNSGKKYADSLYGWVYILNLKSEKIIRIDTLNNAKIFINDAKDFQISHFARTQEFGLLLMLQYKGVSTNVPQPASVYMMWGLLGHFYFPSMKLMNKFYDIIQYPADKRTYQLCLCHKVFKTASHFFITARIG